MFKLCVLFVVVCICCACLMRRILVSICCCHWFMSFVVFLLSFLVVICRLWLRFAFCLLFTTFQVVNIVCFCVHLCAYRYVCCRRIPITLVFSIHATIFAIVSIVVLYVGMVCRCVFLCCSCLFKVRFFLSTWLKPCCAPCWQPAQACCAVCGISVSADLPVQVIEMMNDMLQAR